jgi:hypothetical protein
MSHVRRLITLAAFATMLTSLHAGTERAPSAPSSDERAQPSKARRVRSSREARDARREIDPRTATEVLREEAELSPRRSIEYAPPVWTPQRRDPREIDLRFRPLAENVWATP